MRALFLCAMVATIASAAITCPVSNPENTGCYCTHGCSIDGDTTFPWNSATFPPTLFTPAEMGSDTICARIAIPVTTATSSKNISAYLGVDGQISSSNNYNGVADNTEVVVWTAFTQAECEKFAVRANKLIDALPDAEKLNIDLCMTEACNDVVAGVPAPGDDSSAAEDNEESQLPGECPPANMADTGCYCTNGCSIDGDKTDFPWTPSVWPPAAISADTVGKDTICARITIPNVNSAPGRELAAYLGVNGDIHRNLTTYNGAAYGQTVTIYTAFTASECGRFVTKARTLTDTLDGQVTSVLLCNKESCNKVGATDGGDDITTPSSAFSAGSIVAVAAAALIAACL